MTIRQTRRGFVRNAVLQAAALPLLHQAVEAAAVRRDSARIKLGVIGCGGRGSWIAGLFQKHGGYEIMALADYFSEVAAKAGESLGVDASRRFSGLSGYKKLLASGVEAVALETPPYFLPAHARAAVEAGLHVYMAKPVAVDVSGCNLISEAAAEAKRKKLCFFVDYQIPTDPVNNEVLNRIKSGEIGPIQQVATFGIGGGFADPPLTATIESRLQNLIWVNDIAIGGDYIVNYDIHAIDAALWVIGKRPVAAMGLSRISRAEPHGDSRDVCSVVFEYEDGLVHNHFSQALPNKVSNDLSCKVHGRSGNASINYWGEAQVLGSQPDYKAEVENLYEAGAARNIATFHDNVTGSQRENITVGRALDGALTTILAREAAARRVRLTMDQLLEEQQALPLNLAGLRE